MKICFFFLLLTQIYFSQGIDTIWTKTYGGTEREIGNAVCQTKDDGYIITGITNSFGGGSEDLFLVRTDADGDTLWTKTYGGAGSEWGCAVEPTDDNGYIIAGFTSTYGNGNNDVYLIKTDSNGDTIWTKTYGGLDDDRALSVQQNADDGYIITGVTSSFGAGDYDLYLIKTDANGDTLWTKTYGGTNRDAGYYVQHTSDNGYIITGYTSLSATHRAVFLLKTDSNGDTLWTKIYGREFFAVGASVQQTSDNGYIIAGTKVIDSPLMDFNFYLIKTDANGDTLWTKTYGGEYVDWGFSVQQTSDGGYLIAGTKTDSPEGVADDREANDIFIVKTDTNGDTLWTKTLGGEDHDAVGESSNVMQVTSDYGYIIVGSTKSAVTGNIDIWLIKLEPEIPIAVNNENRIIQEYYLEQNYPNPFNPSTKISWQSPTLNWQTLKVYNVLGNEVKILINEEKEAGHHSIDFNASNLPSGVYFYQLNAGDFIETKKMMLMK